MKTLAGLRVFLGNKLEENAREIKEIETKIAESERKIQEANEAIISAEETIDLEKNEEANKKLWSESNAKKLYLNKLNKLKELPLVTSEEYTQLLNEVTKIAHKEHDEQMERAINLIAEIKKISEESIQTSVQADDLFKTLQRKVYKEPEGFITLPNGRSNYSMDKTYKKNETVHGIYDLLIRGTYMEKKLLEKQRAEQS